MLLIQNILIFCLLSKNQKIDIYRTTTLILSVVMHIGEGETVCLIFYHKVKWRWIRCTWDCIGETRNACEVFVEKSQGKRPLRSVHGWEGICNIKIYLMKLVYRWYIHFIIFFFNFWFIDAVFYYYVQMYLWLIFFSLWTGFSWLVVCSTGLF